MRIYGKEQMLDRLQLLDNRDEVPLNLLGYRQPAGMVADLCSAEVLAGEVRHLYSAFVWHSEEFLGSEVEPLGPLLH
jgi:hypothetical protein